MLTAQLSIKCSVDRYVNLTLNRMFSKRYSVDIKQLGIKNPPSKNIGECCSVKSTA